MGRPYRILHLCDSLSVGGAERLILGLAGQIDRERFAISVCGLGELRGNLLRPAFEALAVPVTVVGSRRFYDPAAFVAVARLVRSQHVDLIHTHLTYADVVGRLVGRLTRRPVVSTLHNEPYDYDRQRLDRRLLQRLTARYAADRLVAVSEHLRGLYLKAWGLPAARVVTIMNAVPLDAFLAVPEPCAQRDGAELVITTIGRLNPQKAHGLLLEAFRLVLARYPQARLRLVGQGRLEQELRAQAAALGLEGRVRFEGVRSDVATVLAESDIFVLSSRWEGLPVTAVEAMAAARPVVLTDVGGCRDLVEHGVNGMLVPPGDPQALAEALSTLAGAAALRRRLGLAARALARRDLGMAAFATRHEALYAELLRARTGMVRRASRAS